MDNLEEKGREDCIMKARLSFLLLTFIHMFYPYLSQCPLCMHH